MQTYIVDADTKTDADADADTGGILIALLL